MSGNRALKRALTINPDQASARLAKQPQITDTTELITPELAQEYLRRNLNNRPVNWKKVDEYAVIMARGDWKLHAQGIVFDWNNVLLTGQTRLFGVIYSGVAVYMRVSRGNPPDSAQYLDRGRPQSARDLATRKTTKAHSPTEASIARALSALAGNPRPSVDELAALIVRNATAAAEALYATKGMKKTRALLMLMAAICEISDPVARQEHLVRITDLMNRFEDALRPLTADQAWGKGAVFLFAMGHARRVVNE